MYVLIEVCDCCCAVGIIIRCSLSIHTSPHARGCTIKVLGEVCNCCCRWYRYYSMQLIHVYYTVEA